MAPLEVANGASCCCIRMPPRLSRALPRHRDSEFQKLVLVVVVAAAAAVQRAVSSSPDTATPSVPAKLSRQVVGCDGQRAAAVIYPTAVARSQLLSS